jgi:MerR family transcriptional regulator/heat shock protein HspR
MMDADEPVYVISIAARIVGVHQQTLRMYERQGLLQPWRKANRRLYSRRDIERVRQIQRLVSDLGVNLAGAEVILRMSERLREAEAENARLRDELQRAGRHLPSPGVRGSGQHGTCRRFLHRAGFVSGRHAKPAAPDFSIRTCWREEISEGSARMPSAFVACRRND